MVSHSTQIAASGTEMPAVDPRLLAHQMFQAVVKSQDGSAALISVREQAAEVMADAQLQSTMAPSNELRTANDETVSQITEQGA